MAWLVARALPNGLRCLAYSTDWSMQNWAAPRLEAAWRMLQHLYGIHLASDSDEANQALGAFIDIYQQTPLIEFDKLVGTLLEWGDEIFAFHDTGDRATNGRIEGTNGKLSVLKRVAYGFVNISNFAARAILLTPGMATST